MKAPENIIEKFLKKFYMSEQASLKSNSEKNKQVVEDALSAYRRTLNKRPAVVKQNAWRLIMKTKIRKLAAAVVIIMAVIMLITYLGNGTLDIATAAFAQMTEAMKKMPWMHMITEIRDRPSFESGEYWFSFDLGIEAIRYDSGKLSFYDYGARSVYVYDPSSEEVTISRLPEKRMFAGGAGSPWHFLENTVELLAEAYRGK